MDQVIKFIADGLLLIILAVAGTAGVYQLFIKTRSYRHVAPYAVMAGLTSLLIGKLLSLVYQPSVARPYIELGKSAGAAYIDNPGFPSDHALLATVIVVMLFALTPYRRLAYVLFVLVIIMSVGRVLALVHTPLDVVAGILVGLLGGIWYLQRKAD
jgi:undecaprenyl-diphosphatase